MEWLSQNWIWLLLGIGLFLLMRRGGMGCCGMGPRPTHHDGQSPGQERGEPPAATRDPVSGDTVDPASALTSVYRGQTYYFASRENRESFEAEPDRYAVQPAQPEKPHKKHGGCC
ncbi:MAG: hypothetical protein H6R07_2135 [Proteobacteria bacterium]|nr:hypothetical protein [Pseudomonadota bacterium]